MEGEELLPFGEPSEIFRNINRPKDMEDLPGTFHAG
jgi:hypothetical protein